MLEKRSNPKGKWCKAHPGTRPIKDFALPMILCNLSLEIEQLIDRELIDETIETCLHEVMEVFYQKDLGLIVENVSAEDNSLVDSFEGRSINPGHSLEAMWFIMDLGKRLGRPDLIGKAVEIALATIEYGWDKQYGGIFYFMLWKPQKKEQQKRQDLVNSLKEGDEIITIGGIYGKITAISEKRVQVEVAEGVVIQMARNAISGFQNPAKNS